MPTGPVALDGDVLALALHRHHHALQHHPRDCLPVGGRGAGCRPDAGMSEASLQWPPVRPVSAALAAPPRTAHTRLPGAAPPKGPPPSAAPGSAPPGGFPARRHRTDAGPARLRSAPAQAAGATAGAKRALQLKIFCQLQADRQGPGVSVCSIRSATKAIEGTPAQRLADRPAVVHASRSSCSAGTDRHSDTALPCAGRSGHT